MSTSISFPANPQVGDTYTYGSVTYVWNGISWNALSTITYLTEIVQDTTPQLGGNLDMNNKNIQITAALATNQSYVGVIETGTVGENVAFGDVLYLKFSDGKWWKANASGYTKTPAVRMALATITANNSGSLLVEGYVRYDSWSFATNKVYLSATTAGAITTTQPSTTGNQIQVIGDAKTSTNLYFKPSRDVGQI